MKKSIAGRIQLALQQSLAGKENFNVEAAEWEQAWSDMPGGGPGRRKLRRGASAGECK
jgi:hypothetical protein